MKRILPFALVALVACADSILTQPPAVQMDVTLANLVAPGTSIKVTIQCFGASKNFLEARVSVVLGDALGQATCFPALPGPPIPGVSVRNSFVLEVGEGDRNVLSMSLFDFPLEINSATCGFPDFDATRPTPTTCTFGTTSAAETIARHYPDNEALLRSGVMVTFREIQ